MHRTLNTISKYGGHDDGALSMGRPRGSKNVKFEGEVISSTSSRWTTGSDELRPPSIAIDGYDYTYGYPLREAKAKKRKTSKGCKEIPITFSNECD